MATPEEKERRERERGQALEMALRSHSNVGSFLSVDEVLEAAKKYAEFIEKGAK